MSSSLRVESAVPSDASGVALVHVRAWQQAYRGLLPQQVLDDLNVEARSDGWAQYLSSPPSDHLGALVVRSDVAAGSLPAGSVLGWVTFGNGRTPGKPDGEGEIKAIYVHPDVQGLGCGRALMESALASLRTANYQRAYLWVLDGNDPAIAFYEHMGFTLTGATKEANSAGVTVVERELAVVLS